MGASRIKERKMDEIQCLKRAQRGDLAAFSELLERYRTKIYAVALRFCRNAQDAEDVAQEAAIKIYRALGRYRAEAAFSTWVYAITRNAAMDFLRRRKKVQEAEYSLPLWEFSLVLPEAGVLDAMAMREGLRALYVLIEALPPAQREVLILRDVDGYAYEEIAELLGISLGTVKSRIARARAAVRQGYDRAKEQTEK